jgi:GPH family glycoside/pentoside/hexuronide:cation symporter
VWEIGLPPALCLIGFLLLVRYPLSEERVYEIKAILKERKNGPAPAATSPA